jgi:hypothetical protein
VNRQIGRILQQNKRSPPASRSLWSRMVALASFTTTPSTTGPRSRRRLLRSKIGDWSDQQLWKPHIRLTQAEAAFRIQKDQLNLRPIWHQRQDRVQAHTLVCFLAFVLWKSLEKPAGRTNYSALQ